MVEQSFAHGKLLYNSSFRALTEVSREKRHDSGGRREEALVSLRPCQESLHYGEEDVEMSALEGNGSKGVWEGQSLT